MEDFGILWIWGFCGDSHRFFCGYGMGMGIKIQSPRQPCELSTDSEVTFRRVLGSAEVLATRPGVDPLKVTRPLPDFSWTTQSPMAASPSVIARPGTQSPAASHVFGPSTTQVGPENPPTTDFDSLH